jgi:hypothetical protein
MRKDLKPQKGKCGLSKRNKLKFRYVPYKKYSEEEIRQAEQDQQKVIDYIYKKIMLEKTAQLHVENKNEP